VTATVPSVATRPPPRSSRCRVIDVVGDGARGDAVAPVSVAESCSVAPTLIELAESWVVMLGVTATTLSASLAHPLVALLVVDVTAVGGDEVEGAGRRPGPVR